MTKRALKMLSTRFATSVVRRRLLTPTGCFTAVQVAAWSMFFGNLFIIYVGLHYTEFPNFMMSDFIIATKALNTFSWILWSLGYFTMFVFGLVMLGETDNPREKAYYWSLILLFFIIIGVLYFDIEEYEIIHRTLGGIYGVFCVLPFFIREFFMPHLPPKKPTITSFITTVWIYACIISAPIMALGLAIFVHDRIYMLDLTVIIIEHVLFIHAPAMLYPGGLELLATKITKKKA